MFFDEIIKEVGRRGLFQYRVLIFFTVCNIAPAMIWSSYLFLSEEQDFWCADEMHNITTASQAGFNRSANNHLLHKCEYTVLTSREALVPDESTPIPPTRLCTRWCFDETDHLNSFKSKYHLVCAKHHLVRVTNAVFLAGLVGGSTLFGMAADKFGRIGTLFIASLIMLIFGVAAPYCPHIEIYAISRFFMGAGAVGSLVMTTVYVVESVTAEYRLTFFMVCIIGRYAGILLMSMSAYLIRDHNVLQLTIALPACLLALPALLLALPARIYKYDRMKHLLIPESPRWLFIKRKREAVMSACEIIAFSNGKHFSRDSVEGSMNFLYTDEISNVNFIDLLKTPNTKRSTWIIWFSAFCTGFTYYFFHSRFGDFSNVYVHVSANAASEITVVCFGIAFANRFGRLLILIILCLVIAVMCVIAAALSMLHLDFYLGLSTALGCIFISTLYCNIWVYATELFPTVVRNFGVGSTLSFATGGFMAGHLLDTEMTMLWRPFPYVLSAACLVVCALLSTKQPATKSMVAIDTLIAMEKLCMCSLWNTKKSWWFRFRRSHKLKIPSLRTQSITTFSSTKKRTLGDYV